MSIRFYVTSTLLIARCRPLIIVLRPPTSPVNVALSIVWWLLVVQKCHQLAPGHEAHDRVCDQPVLPVLARGAPVRAGL